MRIVNVKQPLDDKYIPNNLVFAPVEKVWLEKTTYQAFYQLIREMQRQYMSNIKVKSGYRSYACQHVLYHAYMAQKRNRRYTDLPQLSAQEVVPAGCSEHQLGTCIDFEGTSDQMLWLAHHSSMFGFILRYPEGKEVFTLRQGSYQHYRYVGINHARKMYKCNVCLEEYSQLFAQKNYLIDT